MYCICNNTISTRTSCIYLISFKTSARFSTTAIKNRFPRNPLIEDYLIKSFGFTRDKAVSASTLFPPLACPSNLTSVPDFLKQSGFSDTHIKNLISKRPTFLSCKVEKTLKPKLKLLQDLGISGSSLADLIVTNPNILMIDIDNNLIPTVEFLRSLHHSDKNIVKALKRCTWLLSSKIRQNIVCNVEILRRCGVPDQQISRLLPNQPRFFAQNPDWMEGIVARVKEFGVKQDCGSFIHAVYAMGTMSKANLQAKIDVYKSYGLSELDIISAFRKAPYFLTASESKVRATMRFLIEDVGYEPKDIALRPMLLNYSLEKRAKPRNEVLNILMSRGLLKKKPHLMSVLVISKDRFLQKYVIKYLDEVPDLEDVYC